MAKMTKAQRKRLDGLRAAQATAMNAVWDAAPDNHTPFMECLRMAGPDVAATYRDASSAVTEYERELVRDGRGWLNTFYQFTPY